MATPVDSDVVLAGSEAVNGHYTKLPTKGKFKEPNFHCKLRRLYLFQTKRGVWAVSSRLGGSSYRGSYEGDDLLGSHEWSIFDGASWAACSVDCMEAGPDHEAAASRCLVVNSRFDNIAGLYTLNDQGEFKCEPDQYYNVEDDKTMWHNPRHEGGCCALPRRSRAVALITHRDAPAPAPARPRPTRRLAEQG